MYYTRYTLCVALPELIGRRAAHGEPEVRVVRRGEMVGVRGRRVAAGAARDVAQPEQLPAQLRHADKHSTAVDVARSPLARLARLARRPALLGQYVEDCSRPAAQVGLLA